MSDSSDRPSRFADPTLVPEPAWSTALIPDLTGRTAVVTGANSGLGYHTARELIRHGAHVVLACRDPGRGQEALRRMQAQLRSARATAGRGLAGGSTAAEALGRVREEPTGSAEVRELDLADLASVRRFAQALAGDRDRLDLLVNNAGVMAIPARRSADGFELQLATNHLGPFALTGLLLPLLLRGGPGPVVPAAEVAGSGVPASATEAAGSQAPVAEAGSGVPAAERPGSGVSRVVTVSSLMHRSGRLDRDDLMLGRGYTPYRSYSRSKLANLLFTVQLQRLVDAAGAPLAALAAHPGYAATNLQQVGPAMSGQRWARWTMAMGNWLLAQSAEHGAWPSLRAATDPGARGGDFFGPSGFGGTRGRPVRVTMSARAADPQDAAWLWERSVELTGVDYRELTAPTPAA